MQHTWTIPVDISDKHQPMITVVIKNYKPFTYVVTLKILDGSTISDVIRYDNINRADHLDKFYKYKNAEKHKKSLFGKISDLDDITKLCNYIDKNHIRFITGYFKR
jgi:hypothetical protein